MGVTVDISRSVVLPALVVLAVLGAPAVTASEHATLSVGDGAAETGETTTVAVTLSEIPNGLSGFNVTVKLSTPDAATITDAQITEAFGLDETTVIEDGSAVRLKGIDMGQQYRAGDGPVQLGNVTLRADSNVGTDLTLEVRQVDDGDGGLVNPATSAGRLSVGGAEQTTASADNTDTATTGVESTDNAAGSTTTPAGSENAIDGANGTRGGGAEEPGAGNDGTGEPSLLLIGAGGFVLLAGVGMLVRFRN